MLLVKLQRVQDRSYFSQVITEWDLWNTVFHKSFAFQIMPTLTSRKSNKDLFSEQNLNKALNDVLANGISFRKASKVHGIPIGTLYRYKKKMRPGNIEAKKLSMVTTQVRKI